MDSIYADTVSSPVEFSIVILSHRTASKKGFGEIIFLESLIWHFTFWIRHCRDKILYSFCHGNSEV